MPYKDPARRRQYHRRYKQEHKRQPHVLAGFRVYVCPRFPGLQVGRAFFDGGFLITDNPDIQAEVERHPEFGKLIFPLKLNLSPLRKEDDPEEEK